MPNGDPTDVDAPGHSYTTLRRHVGGADGTYDEVLASYSCYCGVNADHEFVAETQVHDD